MRPHSASLFDLDEPRPIRIEVSDAQLTPDAGPLPLRQSAPRIGPTAPFAAAPHGPRDPDLIDHTCPEMVRMRVFGIPAGYEDQNDHDTLRTDPIYEASERLDVIDTYGLSINPVLRRESEAPPAEAVWRWDETHESQGCSRGSGIEPERGPCRPG